ncbi:hypothetical protein FEM48_Zijuj12G0089300 [Ziziphus jujuba var. spinosa]|uniref:Uncharacterized protein n=1 Tax=Ziziphus jujuba var. spinosa TaxID=714518 RepID=A0A978UCD0_ZIZJJ|nr:hypothetical protein FEM48_Zijuj12G0089300 [Ziziphus jujuba var. spinosa]
MFTLKPDGGKNTDGGQKCLSVPRAKYITPTNKEKKILSHNQLSLAKMNFDVVALQRSKLESDVSFSFTGMNETTQFVDLSRNSLEFDLPKSLVTLDLNHNKIKGSLPVEMTALNLQFAECQLQQAVR